ncbi:MAG: glycosyltransferase [archaeon]
MKKRGDIPSVTKQIQSCFISSYPPRSCGIASFSEDLCTAMDRRCNPKLKAKVVALNDIEEGYNYGGGRVTSQMSKDDIEEYLERAKQINQSEDIKIVCVQHEFGLFGGDYGIYLVPFLELVQKPKVIVFHTVLPNPSDQRKKVVKAIAKRVSAIVVISNAAIDVLERDYEISREKVHVIPHGTPHVPFQDNKKYKEKYGLIDRIVLCSHGWLSKGKGIEYVIKALPLLVNKYPNLTYLILGETHPGASYEAGPKYRRYLGRLVEELNIKDNVIFTDKHVPLPILLEYLLASDICLFTNLEKAQISSGALVRAFGCGRAIVSTPVVYAEELLRDDRGVLVEFRNPKSFAEGIDLLLSNPELRKEIEKNAYFYSRQMTWQNVAFSYLKLFNKIVKLREETTEKFPDIKLDHLKRLTDDLGVIQFAEHTTPDIKSGYTLDDNARALITSILHNQIFNDLDSLELSKKYLNFIEYAQNEKGNFKNQHRNPEEKKDPYSEDAFGRTIWALGFTINKSEDEELKQKSKLIFDNSYKRISRLRSPRAIAFTINGLVYYYKNFPNKKIFILIKKFANKLSSLYQKESSDDWRWFEQYLTYSNAQLPKALFLAYEIVKNKKYLEIATQSLEFLSDLCIVNGKLCPVGQNGWCNRDSKRAFFDQQPIDSSELVKAYLIAYRVTGDKEYYQKAVLAFNWFLGNNHLDQMIYDEVTGGCFDGLGQHSLNFNQGAESTISYLMARLSLEEVKNNK